MVTVSMINNIEQVIQWASIPTILQAYFLIYLTIRVGTMRMKHKIKPPATTGNIEFERVFRIHQNQIEQTPNFLVSLWLFSLFVDPKIACILGCLWCFIRLMYNFTYSSGFRGAINYTIPAYLIIQVMLVGTTIQVIRSFL